jgi:hypothetical protein
MDTLPKGPTREDAQRIVLALWLFLSVIWISYSFSAGFASKVAFIPPALTLVLLVSIGSLFHSVAGEFEPVVRQQPEVGRHASGAFHPIWGLALPSGRVVRVALLAAAVAACAGAVVEQLNFNAAVLNKRTAGIPTRPSNLPTSAPSDAVKPQSLPAEPKRAAINETNPAIGVQPEVTESLSASSKTQDAAVTSFDNNNPAKQPEAQTSIDGQRSSNLASAAAEQGKKDFPAPVQADSLVRAPGKSTERAVSPRRDAWFPFYSTLDHYIFGQQGKRPIPGQNKVAESGGKRRGIRAHAKQ